VPGNEVIKSQITSSLTVNSGYSACECRAGTETCVTPFGEHKGKICSGITHFAFNTLIITIFVKVKENAFAANASASSEKTRNIPAHFARIVQ